MRKYPAKKKRASKKTSLSRKELLEKKRRSAAAKKGWATRRKVAKKKRAVTARPARKTPARKTPARKTPARKTTARKSPARKKRIGAGKKAAVSAARKSPIRARAKKNAKVRAKVKAAEKRRERSRRKTLTPKKRRAETKAVHEERNRIEEARLLDEKLRQIREEEQRRKANKKAVLDSLQNRFKALLEEAKRTGQLTKLPKKQKVESERYSGQKHSVSIRKVLTEEVVGEVMYRVRHVAKRMVEKAGFGWISVLNFASLGESLLGYGQVILSSSLPGASLFQTQGIESTGMMNTKEGMLMKLEEKLEKLAGEKSSTVWVNFITVASYGEKR